MADENELLEQFTDDDEENKFVKTIEGIAKLLASDEGKELASNITQKLKDLMEKFYQLDGEEKKVIKDKIKSQLREKFKEVEGDLVSQVRMSIFQSYALFFVCLLLIAGLLGW